MLPITLVSGSRAAGPGRRAWYGRIALSFMIRGGVAAARGTPPTADRDTTHPKENGNGTRMRPPCNVDAGAGRHDRPPDRDAAAGTYRQTGDQRATRRHRCLARPRRRQKLASRMRPRPRRQHHPRHASRPGRKAVAQDHRQTATQGHGPRDRGPAQHDRLAPADRRQGHGRPHGIPARGRDAQGRPAAAGRLEDRPQRRPHHRVHRPAHARNAPGPRTRR